MLAARAAAQQQEVETTFHLQPLPGVSRYRLQVALDARFTDIVYDGAANGLEQRVALAPGTYYWRYAPAPKETGRFSAPIRIEVSKTGAPTINAPTPRATLTPRTTPTPRQTPRTVATPRPTPVRTGPTPRTTVTPLPRMTPTPIPTPVTPRIARPPANVGWMATVGAADRVVAARLRAGQPPDFVAVNSEGTVYALEGATGAALWTVRYVPGRRAGGAGETASVVVFAPVAVPAPQGDASNVLVAFDGGVRLLEGETGRELWRAALKGRATSGNAGQFQADAAQQIAVATDEQQLYVLDAATGATVSQTKLDSDVVGPPIPFQNGAERGVALTIKGGQVEIRQADGKRLRGVKFDVPFVTPPLVIASPRGTLVVVGSEHGLLFMDGAMKPLGRVTTEGEAPRGRLAAADLDGDGTFEIVTVTNHDRIVVVNADGKIVWSAAGARAAYSPVFADLDGDGTLDVIAADSATLARGFSGRDGTLIWQAGDEANGATTSGAATSDDQSHALRWLALSRGGAGSAALLAAVDPARGALRAVGLPAGSAKVATK
ncbi:MAG: PQQ-binding-like beta-propeller repeat protein [Acidobacteriota bacterium]|nr:PQQ-binding-like beta-propeller repeat protein [Acidobacteriota bacterium]